VLDGGAERVLRSALVLGTTLLFACVQRLDPEQEIVLVPQGDFTEEQEQVLALAAENWNLELGTRLTLSPLRTAGTQTVLVRMSRFVCAYLDGITVTTGEMEVQLCELIGDDPRRLLGTAMHELGHVLGIDEHASEPHAVMALGESDQRYFTEVDHQMFFQAHPGFQGSGEVVRKLASSESRGALVQPEAESPFVLWSEGSVLRFAEIDATLGRPQGRSGSIPTDGEGSWIRTAPVPDGFLVVWRKWEDHFFATRVRLPDAKAGPPVALDLNRGDFEGGITGLSVAHLDGDLYLGVSEDGGCEGNACSPARTWIFRHDASTGAPLPFHLPPVNGVARLVALEDQLFLAQSGSDCPELVKLDREGQIVGRVLPPAVRASGAHENLAALSHAGQVFLAGNLDEAGHFYLARVKDMAVQAWVDVEAPEKGSAFSDLTLTATPTGDIALALSRRGLLSAEIFLTLVEADSLRQLRPWRRMSAEDLTESVQPWLAASPDRLLVLWRDFRGQNPITDVKMRSVPYQTAGW
jgi:hypothetical protein